jgi:SAM-dependent methyltransferase
MLDAASLRRGQRVLDVGCGCGTTSISAAARVGSEGSVTGIDISAPMIDRARQRMTKDAQLTFVCDDAASHAFPRLFETLVSRHGLMFFERPEAALLHLRRQLVSSARVAFVAWQALAANQWLSLPLQIVHEALARADVPATTPGPSPFAFSDKSYVRQLLAHVGFRDVEICALEAPVRISESGVHEAVGFVKLHAGPVGRLLAELDDRNRQEATQALTRGLEAFVKNQVVELSGAAWLVTAEAP